MSVFSTGPGNGIYTKSASNVLGLGATVDANGAFVASTGPVIRYSGANPSGIVTANAGSLSLSEGAAYVAKGGTAWNTLTAVPAGAKGGYQLYSMTTQTNNVGDNTGGVSVPLPNTGVSFAAGALGAGSTVRVRLAGTYQVGAGAPNTGMTLSFQVGSSSAGSVSTGALAALTSSFFIIDVQITVLSTGLAGSFTSSIQGSVGGTPLSGLQSVNLVNTTIDNALSPSIAFTNAFVGTNFDFFQYNVDFFQ
jgi:hypothetical protein